MLGITLFGPTGVAKPWKGPAQVGDTPNIRMIKVQVRPNESLEAAIRRFKRQCNYSGIFKEARAKSYYEKPTTARRNAKLERMRTIRKAERMRRRARF